MSFGKKSAIWKIFETHKFSFFVGVMSIETNEPRKLNYICKKADLKSHN